MFSLGRPILIRPRVPGAKFLRRFQDIVLGAGTYDISQEAPSPQTGGGEVLWLIPKMPAHPGLQIKLIASEVGSEPVDVRLSADQWHPELNYRVYTETARQLMVPLLREYNREYGSRLQLGIPGPRTLPRLPKQAKEILQRYLACANTSYAHPVDLPLFYDFVIHCHEHRVSLMSDDLRALLLAEGLPADAAEELTNIYDHGRALMAWRISPQRTIRALERSVARAASREAQNHSLQRTRAGAGR